MKTLFLPFFALLTSLSLRAQETVAHYDFASDSGDRSGSQAALNLFGNAHVDDGVLKFAGLADYAEVSVTSSDLFEPGTTQAIGLRARMDLTGFVGYGVEGASLLTLQLNWDASLQWVQDLWRHGPEIIAGAHGVIVSAEELGSHFTEGSVHDLVIVLDTEGYRIWINESLVASIPAEGALALWEHEAEATLRLGSFAGAMDDVIIQKFVTSPSGPTPLPEDPVSPGGIDILDYELLDGGDGADAIRVSWTTQSPQIYTVEVSPDMNQWIPCKTLTSNGSVATLTVLLPTGARFLRVREGDHLNPPVDPPVDPPATGPGPSILDPAPGTVLSGSALTLRWDANGVGEIDEWQVLVGTTEGTSDLYESIMLPGTSNQFRVQQVPTDGSTAHITLRYRVGEDWGTKSLTYATSTEDGLPLDREGLFPVAMPDYSGIDQILVLSNRWVIAAVVDIDDVLSAVDDLSGGEFSAMANRWEASEPAGNDPDWDAYTGRWNTRDTYIAQARQQLDETRYERPSTFEIQSEDDTNYTSARVPRRAGRYYVGLDKQQIPGSHPIHYAHYCYLEMPNALQDGRSYTITLADGKSATFLYDEKRTISRAIKVNQAGYLPEAGKKYAYMGAHVYGHGPLPLDHASTFEVINAQTGEVAYTGNASLRERDPRVGNSPDGARMNGEDVYEMDLGGLTQFGNFFISVPGVGRSWTFRHGSDAYGEAFYTAARGLFHQRAVMKYEAPYTHWQRPLAHTDPIYECGYVAFGFGEFDEPANNDIFDIIGCTVDESRFTENVTGGWYDAADWDRNIRHYTNIFDLLNAYELAPSKFVDASLNLPESGNGIPDILDEAEYGLDVWTRSMRPDGGVSGFLETWTHPHIDDTTVKYAFSRRTRWSSLIYAAAAAQLAELVQPFDGAKSARYRQLAERAFAFGNDPGNSLGSVSINACADRGQGAPYTVSWTEQDKYNDPYLFHAKLRLFYLTNDASYLTDIEEHLDYGATPWDWPNSHNDCVSWFYYTIASRGDGIFSDALQQEWRAKFTSQADDLLGHLETVPYRRTWPRNQDFWLAWGASDVTNRGRTLLQAWHLTGDARYRDAALCNLDHMLGANAMGMSWTTGIGSAYPAVLQHEVSETDGIDDPVPGITLYGIDGGPMNYVYRNNVWDSPNDPDASSVTSFYPESAREDVPVFRRWMAHPMENVGQCEFTVHETMASTIFCCAMFLPDGWTPEENLTGRKPRKRDHLFGYWYLP